MKSFCRGFLHGEGEKVRKHRDRARDNSNEVLLTHGSGLCGAEVSGAASPESRVQGAAK